MCMALASFSVSSGNAACRNGAAPHILVTPESRSSTRKSKYSCMVLDDVVIGENKCVWGFKSLLG